MKTKDLVMMALLMGIGFVLHSITPPFFFGMKPDMLLTMMFLGIFMYPHVQNVILLAIGTGLISALTTGFPGGQLPNMIDKPLTASVILALFLLFKKKDTLLVTGILTAVGTVASGSIFLYSALLIVGLPAPFIPLFLTVVLPTTAINTIIMVVLYPIIKKIANRNK
jgi:hypothetical protein